MTTMQDHGWRGYNPHSLPSISAFMASAPNKTKAGLYVFGRDGDENFNILNLRKGADGVVYLDGEAFLNLVTPSQYGAQDGASATTGLTRTLAAGHAISRTSGFIRAWDRSIDDNIFTGVAFTRSGDTLTFASDPGTTNSTTVYYVEKLSELGEIGEGVNPEGGALVYLDGGLQVENGVCVIPDIGLRAPSNASDYKLTGKCDTSEDTPGADALQMLGWTTGASTGHFGGNRYSSGWIRAVGWGSRTAPTLFSFASSGPGGGDFTDISIGADVVINDPANGKSAPIYANASTTVANVSGVTLGSVNHAPSGGGLVVVADNGGGTDCTVLVKSINWGRGGY